MNIFDCFMYCGEDMLLDIRLNVLDKYVKKFVITEANYKHNGSKKKLSFNIKKFTKFKNKIIYIPVKNQPPNILKINNKDNDDIKGEKLILNGWARDKFQRDLLKNGIEEANDNDFIFISDVDEIPNLNNFNINKYENKIVIFNQKMIYYKLNLYFKGFSWFGTKACQKKSFLSPNWLRDIKNKNYSKFRVDTIFSRKKYFNVNFISDGGWHFTNIKTPEEVQKKLASYAHHHDFEESGLKIKDVKRIMKEKKVIYNHFLDESAPAKKKWGGFKKLTKLKQNDLPLYVSGNKVKFKKWLD